MKSNSVFALLTTVVGLSPLPVRPRRLYIDPFARR